MGAGQERVKWSSRDVVDGTDVESEEFGEFSPPLWLWESGKLAKVSKAAERPAFFRTLENDGDLPRRLTNW